MTLKKVKAFIRMDEKLIRFYVNIDMKKLTNLKDNFIYFIILYYTINDKYNDIF